MTQHHLPATISIASFDVLLPPSIASALHPGAFYNILFASDRAFLLKLPNQPPKTIAPSFRAREAPSEPVTILCNHGQQSHPAPALALCSHFTPSAFDIHSPNRLGESLYTYYHACLLGVNGLVNCPTVALPPSQPATRQPQSTLRSLVILVILTELTRLEKLSNTAYFACDRSGQTIPHLHTYPTHLLTAILTHQNSHGYHCPTWMTRILSIS